MKLLLKQIQDINDERVTIEYVELTEEIKGIMSLINDKTIIGYKDDEKIIVALKDVYYIETIDNKLFIYLKNDCLEGKMKLYEFEDLGFKSLLRISKSLIINIRKIKSVKPDISGRLEATLLNGEKILISRKYKKELKERLGM